MPALPAAPGVIRTALSGNFTGGQVWLTRFYTHYSGTAPSNANLATFDAAVVTAYGADIKALVVPSATLLQVESADLSSATGAVDTTAASVAGTRSTASAIPADAAAVVSYTISRRYRGGHPRGYWVMGVPNDLQTAATWTAAFQTAVNAGIAAFFTAVNAAGWSGAGTLTHVNVSYYSGFTVVTSPTTGRARNLPTLRVAPIVDTITNAHLQLSVGTQRRRIAFVD
jgi:hypothetical protein